MRPIAVIAAIVLVAVAGTVVALALVGGPRPSTASCSGSSPSDEPSSTSVGTGSAVSTPPAGGTAATVLHTGDGLDLGLSGDGAIVSVAAEGHRLPTLTAPGGFDIRPAGGTPNLLSDPGFESDANHDGIPDGWSFLRGESTPVLDDRVAHGGRCSIRIQSASKATSGAVAAEAAVHPGEYYVVSAWMRGQGISPTRTTTSETPARIAVQQLAGGRVVDTSYAFGYTDTSGWGRQFVGLQTRPGVRSVRVEGLIDDGSGTLWLDDLYLGALFQPGAIRATGPLTTGYGPTPTFRQHATLPSPGLVLDASYTVLPDRIEVRGQVSGMDDSADRAFTLRWTLPVDARGWRWGSDARADREILDGWYANDSTPIRQTSRYAYGGINQIQRTSSYPFAEISDGRSLLAIGVPLSEPRLFRIGYDTAGGLSISFDLGVSPDAAHLGNAATFAFDVYTADPSWGFRAATQKYYQAFPSSFVRRTDPAREGAWFFAPPLDSIGGDRWRQFGLGLDVISLGKAPTQSRATWGAAYVGFDAQRGIYDSAYTHEWAYFQPRGTDGLPSFDQSMATMRRLASTEPTTEERRRTRDEAQAALVSSELDWNGRPYYEAYRGFYAFYQNLDALGPSAPVDWTSAVQLHQIDLARQLAAAAGGTAQDLSGIHLDSTSGMRRWGAVDDYDRRHWAAATVPLTFSYNSGLVTERGVLAMYGQIARVARFVHDHGMILSANFNGGESRAAGWLGADLIDYFGIEQGLPERAPGPGEADRLAMLKRTLAYHRPVSTLDDQIADGSLTPREIVRRLQQNLFYGIFAGAWLRDENEDHQTRPSWSTPANARLFAPYIPLFKELASAGWEPVTYARSSNPAVWVERFGSALAKRLYFTIRNDTTSAQTATVTVDLRSLGVTAGSTNVPEQVTGQAMTVRVSGDGASATLTISLPAGSTRLISLPWFTA